MSISYTALNKKTSHQWMCW